jgi:hypothetical protein
MFLRDELLMDFWAADILYHLYLTALLIKDPCLTSPHAGHLPDPQFVPLDFKNSSNNVTWRPDFGVHGRTLQPLPQDEDHLPTGGPMANADKVWQGLSASDIMGR